MFLHLVLSFKRRASFIQLKVKFKSVFLFLSFRLQLNLFLKKDCNYGEQKFVFSLDFSNVDQVYSKLNGGNHCHHGGKPESHKKTAETPESDRTCASRRRRCFRSPGQAVLSSAPTADTAAAAARAWGLAANRATRRWTSGCGRRQGAEDQAPSSGPRVPHQLHQFHQPTRLPTSSH